MEGVIDIPAGERGLIRVFALDMRPEQARFLREPGALAQVLGIEDINLDHVEVFPLRDLEELGLAGYLTEGCGVPAGEIAADREALNALEGHILLIRSRAFGGEPVRLTPAAQIALIGVYRESLTDWKAAPVQKTESAKPYSAPRLSPRKARHEARRIGATLFAVVMILLAVTLYLLVT